MFVQQETDMRTGKTFDVRSFGAKGDGVVIDSPAINAASPAEMPCAMP